MTPAGVGKILPGDSKTAPKSLFTRISCQEVLANRARGAEGKPRKKAKQAPRFWLDFTSATFMKKRPLPRLMMCDQRTGGLHLPDKIF